MPSEALSTSSSLAPSYSVLHACLVLGGDVPSCVAQASAYGPLLRNQTQASLSRPTAEHVTPAAIEDILKIHPFAQIIQELQGDDGVEAVIDKTPLSENDKVILEFLRQQNMSSSLMDRVITQVNTIKETFKDSQVSSFWGDDEKKEGEEGQKNADGPTLNSSGLQLKSESLPGKERHDLADKDKQETQGSVPFAAVTIKSSFNVKEKGNEGSEKKKEKDDKGEQEKPERIRTSTDRRGLLIRSRFPHAQVVFPNDPEPVRFHLVP